MAETQRSGEQKIARQLKNAEERAQQAEALYIDVMNKSILLEEERAQASEHFRLAEQKAASVENTFVEIMEQRADLEDKERHLREVEVVLSQQHLEIEARKQVIATEEARLLSEKESLLSEKERLRQEEPCDSVLVVQENYNSEEVGMTIEEAEYLAQKVSAAAAAAAAAAAKEQPNEPLFSTELQDVATEEQNVVALYQTQRVILRPSPKNEKIVLKANRKNKVV